jgi:hypothetical protein
MDTFTIWMLCIVGMMVLYGVFAVWFLVTGVKDDGQKGAQANDRQAAAKGKDAAN